MSHVSSAPELFDEDEHISPSLIFKRIYAFFYNKTVGVVLILLMAVLAFFGTIIMQMPAGALENPDTKAAWLESVRPKYGGWTPVLDFLGFFRMYTSPIFLITCVLLGLSIAGCTLHRLRPMWRAATEPRVSVSDNFHRHAQNRVQLEVADVAGGSGTETAGEVAFENAIEVLQSKRWRVVLDEKNPNSAYADKNRWGPFGTALAHLAFILIMIAFVFTNVGAFERFLTIPVGGTAQVEGTTLSATALAFQDTYTDEGRPADYVTHLLVEDDGVVVGEQDIRVNDPLTYAGYRFHQTSFGIAAQVLVEAPDGQLRNETVALQWTSNDGRNAIGRLNMPEREDLDVLIVTAASGRADSQIEPGTAMIEIYPIDSNQPYAVQQLEPGTAFEWEGYSFTFEREAQYTGVTVRKDLGSILMWIASFLLVLGMIMTFGFPHRRLWLRVDPDNETMAVSSVDKHDAIYERQYRELIAQISGKESESYDD